ncbi:MAG: UDP-N-acetylmuramoyl-L-alanyl-D-glutamate--2,6-diaminopimelate ligase [Sulfobacillus thermotolerans]|uniref:UDP-N-acetylmuramyl-tripeptide synthetase n=1 Tax=Sulfobacillus thermotolerans TaxID=338644 RepID=A0ABM6RNG7_9FIRM|nr:UDP-N-acetylmuramoyl-L-alanyl-D-glutamate--2,6-diaminopimelate ligase [Sulfobacillus thermotolerans]MCY0909868.1 UDP-N-acetylmuramoyl-L-alanyl-D-glutamate--2,6-diaminopimelate ligase [Sulfobacillus thermotolerans]
MDQQLRITESGWVIGPAVRGIRMDSRMVEPGDIFVAVPGASQDGHQFIAQAVARGAVAVVGEKHLVDVTVPYIQVKSSRQAAADLATQFYGHPSQHLKAVAVTGTNGKTSVVYWLSALLNAAGIRTGLISSVINDVVCSQEPAALTTPESPDLQAYLAKIVECGGDAAVVEVSSHGIVQQRVRGTQFQIAILTNITREHLDFHGTMERYVDAKATLFRMLPEDSLGAVLNADDEHFSTIAAQSKAAVTSYGIARGALRARIVEESPWYTEIELQGLGVAFQTRLNHPGRYNIYNVLAASAAAIKLGVSQDILAQEIPRLPQVPGRMQVTSRAGAPMAIVDYAHTPDGLYQSLVTVKKLTTGAVWLVFGARGGRDRGKRPEMGRIAATYADHVVVTADSPNYENAQNIANALVEGIRAIDPDKLAIVELDRSEAIRYAIGHASPADVVLITGRGPETTQHFGDRDIRLVDAEVVEAALQERQQQEGNDVSGVS